MAQDFTEKNTTKRSKDKKGKTAKSMYGRHSVSIHFPKIPSSLSPNSDSISSKSTSACHQLSVLVGVFFHRDHLTFFIHNCSPPQPSVELQSNTMSLQIHYMEDLFSKAKFHMAQNLTLSCIFNWQCLLLSYPTLEIPL